MMSGHGSSTGVEQYLDHLGKEHYPAEGDNCVYCGQNLSVEARELIAKYRTFLDDVLARQVTAAREAFTASQLRLPGVSLDVARNNLAQSFEQQPKPLYAEEVDHFLADLEAIKSSSDAGTPLPDGDIKASATALLTALVQTSEAVASTLADLEKQKSERVEVLTAKERELGDLIARRSRLDTWRPSNCMLRLPSGAVAWTVWPGQCRTASSALSRICRSWQVRTWRTRTSSGCLLRNARHCARRK